MANVDLGFLEPCESWQVESRVFPSKAGGKPAWLDLEGTPSAEDLICVTCGQPFIFLCQIYAPYEEDESNFHRTLFIFVCRNETCSLKNESNNIRIFRSSLKRDNEFYPNNPPNEGPEPNFSISKWLQLCVVCGCVASKKCSKCKKVSYCSRQHQIFDWKDGHKKTCGTDELRPAYPKILFPEFEIVIEQEVLKEKNIDEDTAKQQFLELQNQGKLGTLKDLAEEELIQHSAQENDKVFMNFRKRIEENPDQIMRYCRGGAPLFISDEVKPEDIPNCEYCGCVRRFEFQIMPQMLTLLKENTIDWGVLLFYTCERSCTNGIGYKREYVFKQDVSMNNI